MAIAKKTPPKRKAEEEIIKLRKELKNTQAQLIQAAKMATIGGLGTSILHELNQPLGGVKGFTQMLLKEMGKDCPLRKDLLEIESQTNRMAKIISSICVFARQATFEFSSVDVNTLIENVLMLVSQQLKIHNITVIKDLDTHLPKVNADPSQLQQVFLNVINNARDALDGAKRTKNKELVIITKHNSEFVEISFTDNGCGIAKENLNKVFDPFFTTKSPGTGTGLGLSISSGIVKNHGGLMDISSVKGKGTVLRILLPLAQTKPC